MRRRLTCFLYEGVLLFGVVMAAGLVYAALTEQRHALIGTTGLQAALFIVLGLYFVVCWSHTGQTLAMQTWHIRLVTRDGQRVRPLRAACRYVLSWLWFLPALLTLHLSGLRGSLPAIAAVLAGVAAFAALALLHPGRQYWHDVACGTRLITWRRPAQP